MNGQPNFQPPPATWSITGVVVRNPYLGQNSNGGYAFVTLRVGANQYFDVACSDEGPLQQIGALRSGDDVTIAGKLGKGKLKGVQDEQGRPRYETKLNAEWLQVRQRAPQQQPQYAQQPQPQYAGPQQQYFHQQAAGSYQQAQARQPMVQNPAWPNPQTNPPPYVPANQAPPDPDDGVPF